MKKYYFGAEQDKNTNQVVENINMQETLKEEIFEEEVFLEQEDHKAEKKEKETIKKDSKTKTDSEIKYSWIRTL